MVSHLWFFCSLGAAILWGVGYVLSEKLLKTGMTPSFLIFAASLICFPIYLMLSAFLGELKPGLGHAFSSWQNMFLLILVALTVVGGNYLITVSISEKNATLASLVEIAYPLFTFVFAWILLKEVQLTWESALGGLLIFSGIVLIYLKN